MLKIPWVLYLGGCGYVPDALCQSLIICQNHSSATRGDYFIAIKTQNSAITLFSCVLIIVKTA